MTDSHTSFTQSFFAGMPGWARGVVFALVTVPIALAISGMVLGINVGANIDKYLDIKFQEQQTATETATDLAADRIISVFNSRIESVERRMEKVVNEAASGRAELKLGVEDNTKRIESLEGWACGHAQIQRLEKDKPGFCP